MEKQSFWGDALIAGVLTGFVAVLMAVITWLLKVELSDFSWVSTVITFIILFVGIYYFGNKRAKSFGKEGFTYGQSIKFVLGMMLIAGAIVGTGSYVMNNIIDPEYYALVVEKAIMKNPAATEEQIQMSMELSNKMTSNIFIVILQNILVIEICGLLVGLIASVFVKKPKTTSFFDEE